MLSFLQYLRHQFSQEVEIVVKGISTMERIMPPLK